MKRSSFQHILLLLVILFFIDHTKLFGQSLDRVAIASAGQNHSTSAGTLSFTLGESVVETLNSGIELSQGFHQEWAVVTAVNHDFADQFHISIYPNPTTGWLNITSDVAAHLSLFDLSGKSVFRGEKQSGTENINMGNLTTGLYMLVMYNDKGQNATFKVQVIE